MQKAEVNKASHLWTQVHWWDLEKKAHCALLNKGTENLQMHVHICTGESRS